MNGSSFFVRFVFIFNYVKINNYSFLDVFGLEIFIIFDKRNIFLGSQGPTGTILVPVKIELVPRFGLLPSPCSGSFFEVSTLLFSTLSLSERVLKRTVEISKMEPKPCLD